MNFKLSLVVLVASLMLCMLASQALAGVSNGSVCNDAAKSHCDYCCKQNDYTGHKWQKFGGSKDKICVCTGPSGTKDPAHRNDYNPEPSVYVPKDPRYYQTK